MLNPIVRFNKDEMKYLDGKAVYQIVYSVTNIVMRIMTKIQGKLMN